MLLIHGAWQGAWAFDTWRPQLARRGWKSHAIDLPGNGCDPRDPTTPDAVSPQLSLSHALAALLRMDATPAVVVGHGIGGLVASQLAEAAPHLVAVLVYLAGTMLPSGSSFAELVERCRLAEPLRDLDALASRLQASDGGLGSSLPADAAREFLMHDLQAAAPELAEAAIARLRPQAHGGAAGGHRLSDERFGRIPRIYVEALQDRVLPLPLQRLMQRLSPGAQVISMDCGHLPQLAQPRLLADLVCDAIEALPTFAPESRPA
jgi:pimeloyl-ACP methyl ester carboxylesterase